MTGISHTGEKSTGKTFVMTSFDKVSLSKTICFDNNPFLNPPTHTHTPSLPAAALQARSGSPTRLKVDSAPPLSSEGPFSGALFRKSPASKVARQRPPHRPPTTLVASRYCDSCARRGSRRGGGGGGWGGWGGCLRQTRRRKEKGKSGERLP